MCKCVRACLPKANLKLALSLGGERKGDRVTGSTRSADLFASRLAHHLRNREDEVTNCAGSEQVEGCRHPQATGWYKGARTLVEWGGGTREHAHL